MAGLKATDKLPVGSISWLAEERASALKIAQEEAEDFGFCARNEAEWLNEHVAEIFSENHVSVKDIFKTPGKLRGKTPRTVRKRNPLETRAPLTDVFSATPRGEPSPFRQIHFEKPTPKFQVAQDHIGPSEDVRSPNKKSTATANNALYDSGYHGSQSFNSAEEEPMEVDETALPPQSPRQSSPLESQTSHAIGALDIMEVDAESEDRRTTVGSFQSANEEQSLAVNKEGSKLHEEIKPSPAHHTEKNSKQSPEKDELVLPASSQKISPEKSITPLEPVQPVHEEPLALPLSLEEKLAEGDATEERPVSREADVTFDDAQSPSEGSSPIRPIVRKSSLSFASLPAREPLTTKQSIGNRNSRTSHLDQTRQSYFGRPTGGKSLGNVPPQANPREEATREGITRMDLDEEISTQKPESTRDQAGLESNILEIHNKTSTQRLQDQISKLGQSQSNTHRLSKSIPNAVVASQPLYPQITEQAPEQLSSARNACTTVFPGTFPDEEDESWIGPPHADLTKSNTADAMEGVESAGAMIPPQSDYGARPNSLIRDTDVFERPMSAFSHTKSVSTSQIKSPKKDAEDDAESQHRKGISVSNPPLAAGQDIAGQSSTQPASPTRSYRDSPLKASKEKLSSMFKFSKALFASSPAASAAAKSSGFTPASKRFADQPSLPPPHTENVLTQTATDHAPHPTLNQTVDEATPASPTKHATGRKTRASTEREEKRKEKEAKEAQRMVAQLDKLEKAREKEKQKAREFSEEKKEKTAAAEKQVATQKEQENLAKATEVDVQRVTRTSPRKTKAQLEAEGRAAAALPTSENDDDANEAAISMPPPALPRTLMASQIGKPKELLKRPGRPLKEPAQKAKQAPVMIKVDAGSQRNQNHPSNSALAASLQASLAPTAHIPSQPGIKGKAGAHALSAKASTNSFSSSVSSNGTTRPRALESAARKREQDEREAQRKKEIKLENERKLEEKRQEQQRRKEAERQREKEREQLEAKKASQAARQALTKRKEVEMAKLQRAPPPPARPQANDDNSRPNGLDKSLPSLPQRMNHAPPRSASRMDAARSQDDLSRPINMGYHNATKAPPKRPYQQDAGDEMASRPTMQRSGPSYQQNEGKRRRTGEDHQELDVPEGQPRLMAPPIRQSSIRPKDGPVKALFSNGYAQAPPASHVGASLHKATLQHLHQSKPSHPMDMAQTSKAAISFATSSIQPSAGSSYKTPARPAGTNAGNKSTAKSQARSSPRYQNGEDINLPEIHTDSEDEDDQGGDDFAVPDWADSPALRDQLAAQDSIDPAEVFGPMPELKMEEIFKNKDRWNRFRARTSSANWSGSDRLTEEEIRKDLEGRERLRQEGGWTYGLGG